MKFTTKELFAMRAYHREALLSHLHAYNRAPGQEQAAFDAAAKHAAICNTLSAIVADK